jgi:hypothetical protein
MTSSNIVRSHFMRGCIPEDVAYFKTCFETCTWFLSIFGRGDSHYFKPRAKSEALLIFLQRSISNSHNSNKHKVRPRCIFNWCHHITVAHVMGGPTPNTLLSCEWIQQCYPVTDTFASHSVALFVPPSITFTFWFYRNVTWRLKAGRVHY